MDGLFEGFEAASDAKPDEVAQAVVRLLAITKRLRQERQEAADNADEE